jgi:RNA polymerase sigma-70 factor, ECF subfamily
MVIGHEGSEVRADADLLSRARGGDAEAFAQLIEPLQRRLFRQAAAMCGELTTAEDLVSETLVEAWRCLGRYDKSCQLSTWLYSILLHRFQKLVRRRHSRPISLARLPLFDARQLGEQHETIPSSAPTPAEAAIQSEAARQLRCSLAALPQKHREVILLRFFQGASLPEMALLLGCAIGTVKSRLHHALERLRTMKVNPPVHRGDERI